MKNTITTTLRLTQDLKNKIDTLSQLHNRSINSEITVALIEYTKKYKKEMGK